jgi:5-methylcytosine-specific restriction endonuclease McrA
MKICEECGFPKDLSEYSFDKYKDKIYYRKICRACQNIKNKSYRENNKELVKQRKTKYIQNNKDKIREHKVIYYQKNKNKVDLKNRKYILSHPDSRKEVTRKYYFSHKEYYHLKVIERIARKQKLTIQKFSVKDLNDRMSVFGFMCAYCGGPFQHIDHVKPMIKNGPHCLSNLRPACRKCNLSKSSKSLFEWRFKQSINN